MTAFFSVTNYDQQQHYKDRGPTWIKLYNRLLDDYGFAQLPDAAKWHLIGIFLLASRHNNRIPAEGPGRPAAQAWQICGEIRMTRAKRAKKTDEDVERPAVITPDHARDRLLGAGAGARKGWSRLTVYERGFRRGAFVCKERCTDAGATQAEMRRAGPLRGGQGVR